MLVKDAAAVYSMLWIYQLEVTSPMVGVVAVEPFIMVKVGAERAEETTQVHLSLTEKA